jgi:hypothetical protein
MLRHSSIILFTIIIVPGSSSTALSVPAVGMVAMTTLQLIEVGHASYHFVAFCTVPDLSRVLGHLCVYDCPHLHLLSLLFHLVVVFELIAYIPAYLPANVHYLGYRGRYDCCRGQHTQVDELLLIVLEIAGLEVGLEDELFDV